jgi:hypothetical protein
MQRMPAASFSRQGAMLTGVSNKSISESSITSLESLLASFEVPEVEASPKSAALLVSPNAGQNLSQESALGKTLKAKCLKVQCLAKTSRKIQRAMRRSRIVIPPWKRLTCHISKIT